MSYAVITRYQLFRFPDLKDAVVEANAFDSVACGPATVIFAVNSFPNGKIELTQISEETRKKLTDDLRSKQTP